MFVFLCSIISLFCVHKWEGRGECPCFKFIWSIWSYLLLPTCGGGSPPAPAGHSGSILLRPPQLHSHRGEGFSMDQFPLSKMSFTLWETCGTDHSSSTAVQGMSLEHRDRPSLYLTPKPHFLCIWEDLWCTWLYFLKQAFLLKTHGMGSPSMQRVPNPGLSVRAPSSLFVWGSSGKSLLQRHRESIIELSLWVIHKQIMWVRINNRT